MDLCQSCALKNCFSFDHQRTCAAARNGVTPTKVVALTLALWSRSKAAISVSPAWRPAARGEPTQRPRQATKRAMEEQRHTAAASKSAHVFSLPFLRSAAPCSRSTCATSRCPFCCSLCQQFGTHETEKSSSTCLCREHERRRGEDGQRVCPCYGVDAGSTRHKELCHCSLSALAAQFL